MHISSRVIFDTGLYLHFNFLKFCKDAFFFFGDVGISFGHSKTVSKQIYICSLKIFQNITLTSRSFTFFLMFFMTNRGTHRMTRNTLFKNAPFNIVNK